VDHSGREVGVVAFVVGDQMYPLYWKQSKDWLQSVEPVSGVREILAHEVDDIRRKTIEELARRRIHG